MGVGSGLKTVVGTAEEVTYGTAVAIDRRYEFVPPETLERRQTVLPSQGISGTLTAPRSSRRVMTRHDGGGTVTMEIARTGFGRWLKHITGSTGTIVQQAATIAWLQTYPAAQATGKSLTVQKAVRDGANATLTTQTFLGCKVAEWTLSTASDQHPRLGVTLDARQMVTNVAATAMLAVAAPTSAVFSTLEASLLLNGGNAGRVLSVEATGSNTLKTDSYVIGTGLLKAEPELDGMQTLSGTMDVEFNDPTVHFDVYAADTVRSLKLEWVGPIIASTYAYRLTLDVPAIHLTGSTPTVAGPGVITHSVPWEAQIDGSNSPLYTLSLMSTDTAA